MGLEHLDLPLSNTWFVEELQFSSVQFSCSVVSDSLWPHGLQHARLPCPWPTPGACSNSCQSSRWYHPASSSSAVHLPVWITYAQLCLSSLLRGAPVSSMSVISQWGVITLQPLSLHIDTSQSWHWFQCFLFFSVPSFSGSCPILFSRSQQPMLTHTTADMDASGSVTLGGPGQIWHVKHDSEFFDSSSKKRLVGRWGRGGCGLSISLYLENVYVSDCNDQEKMAEMILYRLPSQPLRTWQVPSRGFFIKLPPRALSHVSPTTWDHCAAEASRGALASGPSWAQPARPSLPGCQTRAWRHIGPSIQPIHQA